MFPYGVASTFHHISQNVTFSHLLFGSVSKGRKFFYSPSQKISNKKRRHPDSNWGIRALQAPALPLGHVATSLLYNKKDITKSQGMKLKLK